MRRDIRVTLLASGGIDSSSLIPFYTERGAAIDAVHFDYGQPSAKGELRAALAICRHYSVHLSTISLGTQMTSQTNGEYKGRNAILLLAAASHGFKDGLVAIGIHAGSTFYDTSKEFVEDVNRLFDGYFNGTVRVHAPFVGLSKLDVYEYSRQVGVPIDITYSCDRASSTACGECPSCIEREVLLARA